MYICEEQLLWCVQSRVQFFLYFRKCQLGKFESWCSGAKCTVKLAESTCFACPPRQKVIFEVGQNRRQRCNSVAEWNFTAADKTAAQQGKARFDWRTQLRQNEVRAHRFHEKGVWVGVGIGRVPLESVVPERRKWKTKQVENNNELMNYHIPARRSMNELRGQVRGRGALFCLCDEYVFNI